MSDETSESIRAVGTVVRSTRFRAIALAIWGVAGPLVYAGGGWVASRIAIADEMSKLRAELSSNTSTLAALTLEVAKKKGEDQRDAIAIGRQCAYASAGFQAYEPAKLRAQKRVYAEKYAHSYEAAIKDGKSPEVAYAALEEQVSIP